MPEETTTPQADPQAGDAEKQPQAGATTTTPEPQAGEGSETISLDEARKLRSEASNLRKRLKELDAAHAELKTFKEQTEASKLSDQEKQQLAQKKIEQQLAEHQSQNADLIRQLKETRINSEIRIQALQMGIDPKAAAKLVEYSEVLTDDDGMPTNIPELLKKLTKEYPTLVGKPHAPTSGGATNPPRSQTSGPQEITKEYVQQVQAGGREAWNALSEQERQRIRRFTASGGLFRK